MTVYMNEDGATIEKIVTTMKKIIEKMILN